MIYAELRDESALEHLDAALSSDETAMVSAFTDHQTQCHRGYVGVETRKDVQSFRCQRS